MLSFSRQHFRPGSRPKLRALTSVGTLALLLLVPGYAQAYRTGGELPEFSDTERVRWSTPIIPFILHDKIHGGVSEGQFQAAAVQSFATWNESSCSTLGLSLDGWTSAPAVPGDGINTIQWMSDWSTFRDDAAAVTDLQYQSGKNGWEIVEADVYLNAESFTWSIFEEEGDRSLRAVLTHELGHALGLLHPCERGGGPDAPECADIPGVEETTMYPFYDPAQVSLSPDDEEGLCFLYPVGECQESCPEGTECTPDGCLVTCGDTHCSSDEQCIAGECVEFCNGEPCPIACKRNRDCPAELLCVEGECIAGEGVLGDPCSEARDCAWLVCSPDGYCSRYCEEDSNCAEGEECDRASNACIAKLKPFGAVCAEANECLGDRCVAGGSKQPLCTRACGPDLSPCPFGWACERVDGEPVCVPPEAEEEGCGCHLVGRRSTASWWSLVTAGILFQGWRRATRGGRQRTGSVSDGVTP